MVIDPGHGGIFSGTCGYSGNQTGYCEKDANLSVALILQNLLSNSDIDVYLTRTTDTEFSPYLHNKEGESIGGDLEIRINKANEYVQGENDNSIFISIHHNANSTNPFIRGIETYYYDGLNHFNPKWPHDPMQLTYLGDNLRLAQTIHPRLVNFLGLPNRKIHNDESFYVIRNAQMPAVLVELGYMINRNEEKIIKTKEFQQKAAEALAEGIKRYFQAYDVLDNNNQKIATFDEFTSALIFMGLVEESVKIFNKDTQEFVFERPSSEVLSVN